MSHPILLDTLSCEFTDKKHASSSLRENASPAFGLFVVLNPMQIIPLLPTFPNAKMTAHPSEVCLAEAGHLKSTFVALEINIWRVAKGPARRKHRLTTRKEARIWLGIHQST